MSMEMDFLRGSARFSKLQEIRNNVIREKINIKYFVLDYIRYKTVKMVWPRAKDGPRKAP